MTNSQKKVRRSESLDLAPDHLNEAECTLHPLNYGILIDGKYFGTGYDIRIKFNRITGRSHNVSFSTYGLLVYYDNTERVHTLILKNGYMNLYITFDDEESSISIEQDYKIIGKDNERETKRTDLIIHKIGRHIVDIDENGIINRLRVPGGSLL